MVTKRWFFSLQALCVNQDVLRLGSQARINERCLDMQGNKRAIKAPQPGGVKGGGSCFSFF
eukprot:scaffold209705_cov17-Prasinocladus_malaysianus.AAC.1